MLPVSDATEIAFKSDGIHKVLEVRFPDLNIVVGNDSIVQGSFQLDEAIQSGTSIECVGCIASQLQLKVSNLTDKVVKGTKIEAYITAGNTDTIALFHGVVDSAKKEANRKIKTIVAYDVLYSLSEKDCTDWYNSHAQTTVRQLLIDTLNKYSIQYDSFSNLVNGDVTAFCGTQGRTASHLSALNLIKSICQVNGCFGKINRAGKFECIYLDVHSYTDGLFPWNSIYPANDRFPNHDEGQQGEGNVLSFYETCEYEDYKVQPVDKVIIRDSQNDESQATYGSGDNKYIIQGNMFAVGQNPGVRANIARNVYDKVHGVYYTPFDSRNNGLPYVECGDDIVYTDITYNPETQTSNKIQFYIFSRTLSGDQFLRDSYKAEGDEYQREFITDLSIQLAERLDEMDDKYNDLEDRVSALEEGGGGGDFNIVSVSTVPASPDNKTLYLIQGEIMIV